jgi:DNA-binding XRE family transcriptional regulator
MAHGYFFGVQDRSMARRNVDELQKGEPDPDDLVAAFGANLKAARLKQGLTQAQLAERAGLLQQYVSLIESGKQNVTLTTAQTLARVVHQNVSAMLRGTAPSGRRK